MVGANSSRAFCSASALPRSTKITWRPESSSRVRPEHRVHRGDLAAVRLQRHEARAQRGLERAHVEHHARRPAQREIAQDGVRHAERRGEHDEVVLEIRGCASRPRPCAPGGAAGRVRHLHRESLRRRNSTNQRPILPPPPMTSARRPLPAPRGHDARLLLGGERGADEQAQQLLGQLRGHAAARCALLRTPRMTSRSRS